jgi:ribA/ribD-fused uncharacterized protein
MTTIESFSEEFRFLSNFWITPVTFEGKTFPSVEHAYVFAKMRPGSIEQGLVLHVINQLTPGQMKKIGREIPLRDDWDSIKLDVMRTLIRSKFSLNDELKTKLLATGNVVLIEGNTWGDVFWGVCNGVGQNNLGKILMEIRDELAQSI